MVAVGHESNFLDSGALSWTYFSATMDAAIWGAELAKGDKPERIYVVEPTGPVEDDPNVTNKKFAGNPTQSYRSREPLRVLGEVVRWQGHSAEQVQQMKESLARLSRSGANTIID